MVFVGCLALDNLSADMTVEQDRKLNTRIRGDISTMMLVYVRNAAIFLGSCLFQ